MMKLNALWLLFLCLILIACGSGTSPVRESDALPTSSAVTGYPANEAISTSSDFGYPTNYSEVLATIYPSEIIVPTPEKDTGVVTGRLVTEANPSEAYLAPQLILSKLLHSNEPNIPPLVKINTEQDPVAVQDRTGKFYFFAIPPGEYAFVISSPLASSVLTNPATGDTYTVSVSPGETHDMGDIKIH